MSSLFRRTAMSALLTGAAATAAVMIPGGGAQAASPVVPNWATVGLSTIHPGIATVTEKSMCTSNFIFLDAGNHAYLGQAAHCSGKGDATQTNGCSSESLPVGTPVALGASGTKGTLVYNSWLAMKKAGEKNTATCANNDFALVSIPDASLPNTNPSIPVFGGPTELRTGSVEAGEAVLSYGASPLRGGIAILSPKQGVSLGTGEEGWAHQVYTATPGVPGDSGSGFFDSQGRAFGVLSTLALVPIPGSNGVADLDKCLKYAQEHSGIKGLHLAKGTAPFAPGFIPAAAAIIPGSGPAPAPLR